MGASLTVVGIRHHAPACARVVRAVLEREQPGVVLVEGPADFNPKMATLGLDHAAPLAVFTHYVTSEGPAACFTPFCAWSPEWVAIQWALARGVPVFFIDLPAWDKAFLGVENRYRDGVDRYTATLDALCARVGVSNMDALWDHLFEDQTDPAVLEEALRLYFRQIRGDDPGGERDGPREAYMRRWLAWAQATYGRAVAVVGGWHAPAIEATPPAPPDASALHPAAPEVPPWEAGGESHLVPWSFERLDSFYGYNAGMPSPGWWAAVWEYGPEAAGPHLIKQTLSALRKARYPLSVADHIAARTFMGGLARMRGHACLQRVDVLDGLVGALFKEALTRPPPWEERAPLAKDAHPALRHILAAFTGDVVGRLSTRTPRPPLLQDVHAELAAHGLTPQGVRELSLDWADPADRARLRVLHRLRLLGIPGFVRKRGPSWGSEAKMQEVWVLTRLMDQDAAIIEASRWGATLTGAAAFRLSHNLAQAEKLKEHVTVLGDAAWIGLTHLAAEIAARVAQTIHACPELGELGPAVEKLLGLWRHGEVLEVVEAPHLTPLLSEAGERMLSLLATFKGTELPPDDLKALRPFRTLVLQSEKLGPSMAMETVGEVLQRRMEDRDAPATLRGAALGLQVALATDTRASWSMEAAISATQAAASEGRLGDFLTGLFFLARTPALRTSALLEVVDRVLQGMPPDTFLTALPSLRLGFSFFPPAEREQIAQRLLQVWGEEQEYGWWRSAVPADTLAEGVALDGQVEAWGRALGLLKEEPWS